MAIKLYEDFYPYVQPYVPECPEFAIEQHLAESAARFCKETYIWRVDFEEDTMQADEPLYDIDIPAGTVLEDVIFFEVDGQPIQRVSDRHVAPMHDDAPGIPQWYDVYLDTQVRVFPVPNKEYVFRGTAIVKPSLTAKGVEAFIYETFGRCIADGAIAQLTAIPGKAWSNPMLSAEHQMRFGKGIADAKRRDFKSVPLRVAPRKFA